MEIKRKKTRPVKIGNVTVGGNSPISIQSMTSSPTKDVGQTLEQMQRLEEAGCEIIRVGIPDEESARAIRQLKKNVSMPIVADIHFDYRLALLSIESGADEIRLNPGNIKKHEFVREVVSACQEAQIPIRIGVNGGSIDKTRFEHPTAEALVNSAFGHIAILENLGFFDIKVSLKSSDVLTMIEANRLFSQRSDYPIHLGVTEAGGLEQAIIKSALGVGTLLLEGIGDTLRISITDDVVKEVETARTILRSLGLRKEGVEIISCPTCARKEFDVENAVRKITEKTRSVKKYIKVAVMGCVVNGPGEASEANIGVAVGKTEAVFFKNGEIVRKIPKDAILNTVLEEIERW